MLQYQIDSESVRFSVMPVPQKLDPQALFDDAGLPPDGDLSLTFRLAGISISFAGISKATCEGAMNQYGRFLADPQVAPEHTVRIRRGPEGFFLPYSSDLLLKMEIGTTAEGRDEVISNSFAARRNNDEGVLVVLADEGGVGWKTVLGAMENYVRWLVAQTLIRRNGIVLHSSGIVRDGKAYVFFGHSGAGKSTVAELSQPLPILSDDMVVLLREPAAGGSWQACSTPFAGNFPQDSKAPGSFPLAGLYLLKQATMVELRPVALPVAIGMLSTAAPFLSREDRVDHLIPLLNDLCQSVPAFELYFKKDASFWDIIIITTDNA